MTYRILTAIILFVHLILGTEIDFRGQLSLQGSAWNNDSQYLGNVAAQYIPNLHIFWERRPGNIFDIEASVFGSVYYEDSAYNDDFRTYRLNARYATRQSELQIGLQRINFGPAQLLRSLMWFDRLNPTDPLKVAEGVWGLRYRYIFLNNANIWLWGLYGNDEPKGYEVVPTQEGIPEFGFRGQIPVTSGELAFTFHARTTDEKRRYEAFRFGLDGRWDWVLGWWFEAVVDYRDLTFPYDFGKMITVGADYTFGIGNGLYILAEHMLKQATNDLFRVDERVQLSALMLNYPLGMFDNLSLMTFYSWDSEDFIQYASWQRAYDKISINLALFHFPDINISTINTAGGNLGIRLMLIYNH